MKVGDLVRTRGSGVLGIVLEKHEQKGTITTFSVELSQHFYNRSRWQFAKSELELISASEVVNV